MKQFKIGDIVAVTKQYRTNDAIPGNIVKIVKIDEGSIIPYLVEDFLNIYNWRSMGASLNDWCVDVRIPTTEELEFVTMTNNYEIY